MKGGEIMAKNLFDLDVKVDSVKGATTDLFTADCYSSQCFSSQCYSSQCFSSQCYTGQQMCGYTYSQGCK
ncbi:MAG: elgicin/penisin family lantibiotic [Clostridium sp.]|nr:elgicin/penisin family lantibiotic [Clostridium sp.]